MRLIKIAVADKQEGDLLAAQNPITHECLYYRDEPGTDYAGPYDDFVCRTGRTGVLGVWDETDPENPVLVVTADSIREQFNAHVDIQREQAYRTGVDRLLAEAWRKEIDPDENGQSRGQAKQAALAEVRKVKERYPKI